MTRNARFVAEPGRPFRSVNAAAVWDFVNATEDILYHWSWTAKLQGFGGSSLLCPSTTEGHALFYHEMKA